MGSPAPESELGPTELLYDHPPWHKLELSRPPSTSAERPPGFSAEPPGELLPSPFTYLSPSPAAYSPRPSTMPNARMPQAVIGIGAVAAIVAVGLVLVIALFLVCFYINKRRKLAFQNLSNNDPPPSPGRPIGILQSSFTYEELKVATDNFSEVNFLGQGGFGNVHKGFLPNGTVVAIKQLKPGSRQGEREFQAEVDIISRVHHRHLVSLVGYCMSKEHRLLVYEFVPNKTLQFHLHEKGRPVMGWPIRMKIALGAARGLAYLHEDCRPRIIHRDIKATNILIDESFEAKVADFGLARFFSDTDTHVSTRVMGTFGYMAPEYASSGKLTEKSDTFSFGVLLLELITGRRPIHQNNNLCSSLVDWARPLLTQALEDDNFIAFVDPNLEDLYDPKEMKRMVACAAACVRQLATCRPPMSQIARTLEGIIPPENLNEAVIGGQSRADTYPNSEYGSSQNIFNSLVLESGEHGSSSFTTAGDQNLSDPSAEVRESGEHGGSTFIAAGDQTTSGPSTEVLEGGEHGSSAFIAEADQTLSGPSTEDLPTTREM